MKENIQKLLDDPYFQAHAADVFRSHGLQPPANPGYEYLAALQQVDPQGFPAIVQNAAARGDAHASRMETLEKVSTQLPAAKVAEAWKALPQSSRLRQKAADRELDAAAQRRGITPLPGMSAAETLMAYLHAIGNDEQLRSDESLAEIASATGNALGDANGLREVVDWLGNAHETDMGAERVAAIQDERQAAIDKARGIVRAKEEPPEPGGPQDTSTRAEVARQFAKTPASREPLTFHAEHDDTRTAVALGMGAKIEASPRLQKEAVREARELGQWPSDRGSVPGGSSAGPTGGNP